MYNIEKSPLRVKSVAFAARITKMVDYLQKNSLKKNASIYNQVLRSGTSIMANVSESQFAQSRADFITKLHIALKEANETNNWLILLYRDQELTEPQFLSIHADCNELIAMLVASLNTSKKNNEQE